jgi:hypothetical protein
MAPKIPLTEIVSKIIEKPGLAILLVGIALVLFATLNGYPPMKFLSPVGRDLVLGLGLLLTGAGYVLILRERAKISTNKSFPEFGFKIDFIERDPECSCLYIEGTFKVQPSDQQVHIFVLDHMTRQFWPTGLVLWDTEAKAWKASIRLEDGLSSKVELIVAWVGPNSIPLIKYYRQCTQELGIRRGIEDFPQDFIRLASKRIPPG